jgi:hypothetical protein
VALNDMLRRHDALRMRFVPTTDSVRQIPVDGLEVPFEYLESQAPEGFVRPFDLAGPPLLRAALVRTEPDLHELYLDSHHIVFDGMSLRVFIDELFEAYAGTRLLPPAMRYVDAAQWSHDQAGAGEAYWLKQLANSPADSGLPTDRPRGDRRASHGDVITRVLGPVRTEMVELAALRHNTTAFTVLLAAYTATLARLSGRRDIVVGAPAGGRSHPGFEGLVGMFVSTICLRAELTDGMTLGELADRLAVTHREAMAHQAYPFERLVRKLGVPRDPARNPLFDAFLALHNIAFYEFAKAGLSISVDFLNPGTTRFDVNLQAYQRPDGLLLELQYATELYDSSSMTYLLDQFLQALGELLDEPATPAYGVAEETAEVALPDFVF